MLLVTARELPIRFRQKLRSCERLDIAVAYCCPGGPVDDIVNEPGVKVRALLGIDDAVTSPAAIRALLRRPKTRVRFGTTCPPAGQRFHPKVYIFHGRGSAESRAWIGSANLTTKAFDGGNEELCIEIPLDRALEEWFELQWNAFKKDADETAVARYEEARVLARSKRLSPNAPKATRTSRADLAAIRPSRDMSWKAYFARLELADSYWRKHNHWSVFDESFSYLETLQEGHSLAIRSWDRLTHEECAVLMPGWYDESTGNWGLLGSMQAAAKARQLFRDNKVFRRSLRKRLEEAIAAPTAAAFREGAKRALQNLPDRVGPGVITRLLTLARPDLGVSVNTASSENLAKLAFGRPLPATTLGKPKRYAALLEVVHEQPWFVTHEPMQGRERLAWQNRAALIDALVYAPES